MELCYLVPNQFLSNAKINSSIQRELLFKSTNTPNVYFNKLDTIVKKVAGQEPEIQKSFGIELDYKPVQFKGRVLPTPRQLNGDTRGPFHRSTAFTLNWSFITFDEELNKDSLSQFARQMADRAAQLGIKFNQQPFPLDIIPLKDPKMLETVLFNIKKKANPALMFVGIPARKFSRPSC